MGCGAKREYRRAYVFSLLLFVGLASTETQAGWFGPRNYDECILESMKGASSDLAAQAIIRSCREKFPEKKKEEKKVRDLSADELGQLTGRAVDYGSYFSGHLHNGNNLVTITQLSISVTTKIGGQEVTQRYTSEVNIPSNGTGKFGFRIITGDQGEKYSWSIVGARGY